MGIFRKQRNRITVESPTASATRAVHQTVYGAIPHLEFRFQVKGAGEINEVVIDMTFEEGTKFIQQAVTAQSIIAPPIRTRSGPIGG
jgi:hypothetical protein